MMIEQSRVHRIKDLDSLARFLRDDLSWDLPEASIDDVSFEWTGVDLNLSESIHTKLKDGVVRQLQPFSARQPWGIFVIEFAVDYVSIITLRQILRCFVAKRRGARPDLPAWQCENLLFICLYGENGFTFAHFKGDKPYSSKLTTFSWHPGEPIRTVCEFNLPALEYDDTWMPEAWVTEWQKAFDVEKVNKQFYRQISQFYYRLTGKEGCKRELVLPYVGNDPGSIGIYEEFAVRLIGRSIFCWFLKHKLSEASRIPLIPPEALSLAATRETGDFYHSVLEPLFFEVMNKPREDRSPLSIPRSEIIPFLNGGLFEPHHNDFYTGEPNYGLKIPDAWFIDFFGLLERYNFTITENSSIDVDVAVDPEMLGRIFENLLAEVVPETGETARKATGSYYTPRAIVDYMVEQSLKQYLLSRTELGEEKVNRLLNYGESVEDFLSEEKLAAVTALREIRVIDPACGSGAFPMGVLHRMLAVLEKADPRLELWQAQYLKSLDGIVRQTVNKNISRENWAYIRKLMIIRDSIYGVDIQQIAVEIAKLRCFLSLVVDELVVDDEDNRGVEPLPNLEFKFVAANSLIGLPPMMNRQVGLGIGDEVGRLKSLRGNYLRSYGWEKKRIEEDFREARGNLVQQAIKWGGRDTLAVQLATWDPFSDRASDWFDPDWMFGVENGFDIVIANPPYLGEKGHKEIFRQVRQGTLKRYYQAKMDLFYFFLHLAIDLGNDASQIAFITTNYYTTATYANKLRQDLKQRTVIRKLINFNELRVFESALGQHNMITILSKEHDTNRIADICMTERRGDATEETLRSILSWQDDKTIYYKKSQDELYEGDACYIRLHANRDSANDLTQSILGKVEHASSPLGQYCNINRGVDITLRQITKKHLKRYPDEGFTLGERAFTVMRDHFGAELRQRYSEVLKDYVKSSDISKYGFAFSEEILLYIRWDTDIGKFPEVRKHLQKFRPILEDQRDNYGEDYPWYALHRPRNQIVFESEKILVPYRSKTNTFGYAAEPVYGSDDVYFITDREPSVNLKYVLALLNSKLFFLWLYHKGKRKGETLELYYTPLSEVPIRVVGVDQKPFISIADSILAFTDDEDYLNSKDKQSRVEGHLNAIDYMIYELYSLTPAEIALVEECCGRHIQ